MSHDEQSNVSHVTQLSNKNVQTPQPAEKANDLSNHVTYTVKQTIVSGEYIYLATLLVNSLINLDNTQKNSFIDGELLVQPKQTQIKITNIELWTDASIILMDL